MRSSISLAPDVSAADAALDAIFSQGIAPPAVLTSTFAPIVAAAAIRSADSLLMNSTFNITVPRTTRSSTPWTRRLTRRGSSLNCCGSTIQSPSVPSTKKSVGQSSRMSRRYCRT